MTEVERGVFSTAEVEPFPFELRIPFKLRVPRLRRFATSVGMTAIILGIDYGSAEALPFPVTREVGDFVLVEAGGVEGVAGLEIEVGDCVVVGDVVSVVAGASGNEFAAQARVFVNFEHVDADVWNTGCESLGKRVGPGLGGLVRQSSDDVERYFGDAGRAQVGDVAEGDVAIVKTSDGACLLIYERLHAQ